jgi:hypothetical protein
MSERANERTPGFVLSGDVTMAWERNCKMMSRLHAWRPNSETRHFSVGRPKEVEGGVELSGEKGGVGKYSGCC